MEAALAPSQEEIRGAMAPAFLVRLADRASGLKEALLQPRLRAAIYAAAVTLLTVGFFLAIRALPDGLKLEHPAYGWGVFLITAPAIIAMNTVETEFTARVLGVRFGWRKALRIAVMSSAANVLPLPGGPMVRAAALKEKGVKLVRSGAFISAVTGFWLGFVFLYTGACLAALARGQLPLGGFFAAIGAIGIAISVAWLRRLSCSWGQICVVGILKIATTLIGVIGLWWSFALLGAHPGFFETSVFAVSSASSLVVTFVPAGIGVTESLSAGVAMLVSISPALAFLVSAIFRLIWLAFLLPLASVFAVANLLKSQATS